MQMKLRERCKRACQRPGRGEINEGDSGSPLLENGKRKMREMMYGGNTGSRTEGPQRGNRTDEGEKISGDGECLLILH